MDVPNPDLVPEQLVSLSGEDIKMVTLRDLLAKDGTKLKELALACSSSPPALEVYPEQDNHESTARPPVEASSPDASDDESGSEDVSSGSEDVSSGSSSTSVTRSCEAIKPLTASDPPVNNKTGEKRFKCNNCDKVFARHSNLYVYW
jgi:hypothetical protein